VRYDILNLRISINAIKAKETQLKSFAYQLQLVEQGISTEVTQEIELLIFRLPHILVIDNIVKCAEL
jgi:hypothetical protein